MFLFPPHVTSFAPACSALLPCAFFWVSILTWWRLFPRLSRLCLRSQRVSHVGKKYRWLSQTCYKSPYLYLLLWDDGEETWKVTVFRVVICWVNVLSGRRCLDCKCEVIVWVGQYNGLMLWMNYSDSEVFLNHVKRVWISRLKRAEYCLSLSHFTLSSSPSA